MAATPDNWNRIKELFGAASEMKPAERAAYLAQNCDDQATREQVERLLRDYQDAGAFLDAPALRRMKEDDTPGQTGPDARFETPSIAGSTDSDDPMLGRRVGAYRLLKCIGRGGMAAVFLAARADDEYQKEVAVKLVQPNQDRQALLDRFRHERQTLADLDHPHIVKLLDGGSTWDGLSYLVMDYVEEGTPIDDYCDRHRLSIEARLKLFRKVCEAVQYAHRKLVIHRDLKPSNILVTADGTPKLLDFGIAKVLSPQPSLQLTTQTGARCMTPAYASPEQMRCQPITTATDVYSLGVVLYELLSGHRPYRLTQHTPAEIERAICEQDPEAPSTAIRRTETETSDRGVPLTRTPERVSETREGEPEKLFRRLRGDLDNIVLKALQKEPARRYRSVEEFSQDIRRHLEHLPVAARPSTISYRLSRLLWHYRAEALGVGVLILVLALAGAVASSSWRERKALQQARAELGGDRLPGRPSVAVLGFKNLSGRSETAWVSPALAELLTAELAAGGAVRTIPGEDVAHMQTDLSLPEPNSLAPRTLSRVRRYLKTDYVVAGSYLDLGTSGSPVRLDMRLQDAARGETLASLTLTGVEADLPDLAARAGAILRGKLGAAEVPASASTEAQASQPSNLNALRLYSEGIEKLHNSDLLNGRTLLEQAVAADPDSALAHAALAEAWGQQGYDAKAREESQKALALADRLPREQSLVIEGEALRVTRQWQKDAEIYRTLFTFFPDNLDYGVLLVTALSNAGKGADAMATVEELRKLPKPMRDDAHVDLAEARASESLPDFNREAAAAERAAEKARVLGVRGLQAQALFAESRALLHISQTDKGIATAEQARELWQMAGDRYGVARALNSIGYAEDDAGRYQDAERAFSESLKIMHDLGNRWNEATALLNLGVIRWRVGDRPGAKQKYQESLAISRELGNMPKVAMALVDIAVLEIGDGSFSDAKVHLDEALAIDRARGDQAAVGADLSSLSNLYLAEEDKAAAKMAMEETIQISRKLGQKNELGEALGNLGGIYFDRGEMLSAGKCFAESLQIFTTSGNQYDRGLALRSLADFTLATADINDSRKYAEEAVSVFSQMGAKSEVATTQMLLARLLLEQRKFEGAESLARQSLAEFRMEKSTESEGDADAVLARALREQGRLEEAKTSMASARDLTAKTQDHEKRIFLSVEDGRLEAALGNDMAALEELSRALAEAKKADLVPVELEARLALGQVEVKSTPAAGRKHLASLEQEARRKGFILIARKAVVSRSAKDGLRE